VAVPPLLERVFERMFSMLHAGLRINGSTPLLRDASRCKLPISRCLLYGPLVEVSQKSVRDILAGVDSGEVVNERLKIEETVW
jgi:hypothetical protein